MSSRMNNTEERVSDLEDRLMAITQWRQHIERQIKKKKKWESNIRDLLDNIKHAILCTIGIPKGEERENIFEEILAETFPNLKKESDIQIREALCCA